MARLTDSLGRPIGNGNDDVAELKSALGAALRDAKSGEGRPWNPKEGDEEGQPSDAVAERLKEIRTILESIEGTFRDEIRSLAGNDQVAAPAVAIDRERRMLPQATRSPSPRETGKFLDISGGDLTQLIQRGIFESIQASLADVDPSKMATTTFAAPLASERSLGARSTTEIQVPMMRELAPSTIPQPPLSTVINLDPAATGTSSVIETAYSDSSRLTDASSALLPAALSEGASPDMGSTLGSIGKHVAAIAATLPWTADSVSQAQNSLDGLDLMSLSMPPTVDRTASAAMIQGYVGTEQPSRSAADWGMADLASGRRSTPPPAQHNKTLLDTLHLTDRSTDAIVALSEEALTPGSIYTHDIHTEEYLQGIERTLSGAGTYDKNPWPQSASVGGSGGGGFTPPPPPGASSWGDSDDNLRSLSESADDASESLAKVSNIAQGTVLGLSAIAADIVSSAVSSIGASPRMFSAATTGILGKTAGEGEVGFNREIRQVAFQTEGITSDTSELQNQYAQIGDVVGQTGKSQSAFQSDYVRQLRKGFRSQQDALSVTKTSLNLSTMIGSSAEGTSDLFRDFSVQLKMSNGQTAELGRGMQRVAQATGVTGDNLLAAADASKDLLRNMANVGTLSAESAENVIGLQAALAKRGISDSFGEVGKSLTSMKSLLMDADEQTQAFVLTAASAAGLTDQAIGGTLMASRDNVKAFAGGIRNQITSITGGVVTSLEQFKKLDELQKAQVSSSYEIATGKSIFEAFQYAESLDESAKTYADRVHETHSELARTNNTLEETESLQKRLATMQMGAGLSALSQYGDAIKDMTPGGSLDGVAVDVAATLDPAYLKQLEGQGFDISSAGDTLRAAALDSARIIKEQGGEDLSAQVQAAFASGDGAEVRTVLTGLDEAQQTLSVATATDLTPMDKLDQSVLLLNATIRKSLIGPLMGIIDFAGPLGLIAAGLGGGLLSAGLGAGSVMKFADASGIPRMSAAKSMLRGGSQWMANNMGGKAGLIGSSVIGMMGDDEMGRYPRGRPHSGHVATDAVQAASSPLAAAASPAAPRLGFIDQLNGFDYKKAGTALLKGAAGLAVFGAGLAILGGSLLLVGKAVQWATGMSWSEVAETAAGVTLLIASVGAIGLATLGASKVLSKLAPLKALATPMAIGAVTLAILAPALTALAGGLVLVTNGITDAMGVDAGDAATAAGRIAALIASAGLISAAVLGTSIALGAIGLVSPVLALVVPLMFLGAAALRYLAPAVTDLAASVVNLTQGAMDGLGVNAASAGKTALDLAGIIASAGLIAAAVLGTSLALGALGVASPAILLGIPLMYLGAAAIRSLTPSLVDLASSIVGLTQGVMDQLGVDARSAGRTALNVAGIIASAGLIAAAVMGTSLALGALGAASPAIALGIPLILLGAAALQHFAPAIVTLATSISEVVAGVLAGGVLTPDEAAKTAEDVASLLGSSGSIAGSIITAGAGLSIMGAFSAMAALATPLMFLGAAALSLLAKPVAYFAHSMLDFADQVSGEDISHEKSVQTADGVASILGSATTIAGLVIAASAGLSVLGALSPIVALAAPLMFLGAAALSLLAKPVSYFANAMLDVAGRVGGSDPAAAAKLGEDFSSILKSSIGIAQSIAGVAAGLGLAGMASLATSLPGVSSVVEGVMMAGVGALQRMGKPVAAFVAATRAIASEVMGGGDIDATRKQIEGMAAAAELAGSVSGLMDLYDTSFAPLAQRSGISGAIGDAADGVLSRVGLDGIGNFVGNLVGGETKTAQMAVGMEKLGGLVNGVMSSAATMGNIDPTVAGEIGKKLTAVAGVITGIASVATVAGSDLLSVVEFEDGWIFNDDSLAKKLSKQGDGAKAFFTSFSEWMTQGIIIPVYTLLPSPSLVYDAQAKLQSLGPMMEALSGAMGGLSTHLLPFVNDRGGIGKFWSGSTKSEVFANNKDKLAVFLTDMMTFVKDSILTPVKKIDKDSLQALPGAMNSINDVVYNLRNAMHTFGKFSQDFLEDTVVMGVWTKLDALTEKVKGGDGSLQKFLVAMRDNMLAHMANLPHDDFALALDNMKLLEENMLQLLRVVTSVETIGGLFSDRQLNLTTGVGAINAVVGHLRGLDMRVVADEGMTAAGIQGAQFHRQGMELAADFQGDHGLIQGMPAGGMPPLKPMQMVPGNSDLILTRGERESRAGNLDEHRLQEMIAAAVNNQAKLNQRPVTYQVIAPPPTPSETMALATAPGEVNREAQNMAEIARLLKTAEPGSTAPSVLAAMATYKEGLAVPTATPGSHSNPAIAAYNAAAAAANGSVTPIGGAASASPGQIATPRPISDEVLNFEADAASVAESIIAGEASAAAVPRSRRGEVDGDVTAVAAKAMPLTDVHEQMITRRASEESSESNSGGAKTLERIAAAEDEQIALLGMIHEDLREVIAQLKPVGNSGTAPGRVGSTRLNRQAAMASPTYGRWHSDSYRNQPHKQMQSK